MAQSDKLLDLTTRANLEYARKNYDDAADLYSDAVAVQAEQNGEMAPENAELLFLYGKCLFQVAVSKSDVLGGRVAEEDKKKKAGKIGGTSSFAAQETSTKVESIAEEVGVGAEPAKAAKEEEGAESKPYFSISGMENWEDEEDEDAEEAADAEAEEEEDDFATAYEILDLARVLLKKQLDALHPVDGADSQGSTNVKGKGPATASDTEKTIMTRMADAHDLQAEISLENEQFHNAVSDSRAALELKQELYPQESSLVAEAHFKLSLALEFASVTQIREVQQATDQAKEAGAEAPRPEDAQVDEAMREEAAQHLEKAIESCRLRIAKEEMDLQSDGGSNEKDKNKSIEDVKGMVKEMEQRVSRTNTADGQGWPLTHLSSLLNFDNLYNPL